MRKRHGRRKPMSEINVVPYIDVTLVLLIIFMITTPMLQTGVDVDLPAAESATVEQEEDKPPVIVTVKQTGEYFLRTDYENDEPVIPETITTRVTKVLAEKPGTQVLINADNGVEYGIVVTVMAALKNAGVPKVGLMTKKPEESDQ